MSNWWDDVVKAVTTVDLDPRKSSAVTGVGTPWGATGEKGAIDLNPFHSTVGRIVDPFGVGSNLTDAYQGMTGLQGLSNRITGPRRGPVPVDDSAPYVPTIGGAQGNTPFSSLALEERLRSENRAKQPKNVEYGFNLEKTPKMGMFGK